MTRQLSSDGAHGGPEGWRRCRRSAVLCSTHVLCGGSVGSMTIAVRHWHRSAAPGASGGRHTCTLTTSAPLPPCRTDMGGKKEDVCEVEIQGVW